MRGNLHIKREHFGWIGEVSSEPVATWGGRRDGVCQSHKWALRRLTPRREAIGTGLAEGRRAYQAECIGAQRLEIG